MELYYCEYYLGCVDCFYDGLLHIFYFRWLIYDHYLICDISYCYLVFALVFRHLRLCIYLSSLIFSIALALLWVFAVFTFVKYSYVDQMQYVHQCTLVYTFAYPFSLQRHTVLSAIRICTTLNFFMRQYVDLKQKLLKIDDQLTIIIDNDI